MAQASVTEVQNQLLVARDVQYMRNDEFHQTAQLSISVHKLINGLMKSSKDKNT